MSNIEELIKRDTAKALERDVDEDGDCLGYICPNCGNGIAIDYDGLRYFRFCGVCGQRLDWTETDVYKSEIERERIIGLNDNVTD